jgi:hypothetical protein
VAVAFDAVGPSSAGQSATATTTLTWSHTCAGTNRYVLVGVSMGQFPDTGRTMSATFGGTSMTSLGLVHSGGSTAGLVQLFGLINPATGASTVTVTASGTTDTLSGGSVSFTGVDQTTPVGTAVTASGTSTAPSATVTGTTAGNMVAAAACTGTSTGFTASGNTSRWTKNVNGNTGAGNNAGSTAAASGSVSMSFTTGASDLWGAVAVEVKAASGGGGGTTFTVGKTTDGTSSSASSTDKVAVSSAVASNTGTLISGVARLWLSAAGSAGTKMVVYADSAGAPGALLATSDETVLTSTTEAGVSYTFSSTNQITIVSGVTYWIGAFWADPGTPSVNLSRDATAAMRQEVSGAGVVYPTPPNPYGTPTANAGPMDAYITADTGGNGTARPATATRRDYLFTSGADTLKQGYWSNGDLATTDTAITDVVFVIHGTDRDPDVYVTYAMDSVTQAGLNNRTSVLVVAPHFIIDTDPGVSTTPDWLYWSDSGWKDGNLSQSDTYARPFRIGSYAALDSMILKAQTSYPNLARVRVIGHSAGGQYVNRYAATSPVTDSLSAGIDIRFVIANPSSYLYMDSRRPHAPGGGVPGTTTTPTFSTLTSGESTACPGYDTYKYGLAAGLNSYVSASTNATIQTRYQGRKVTYLAGELDNANTNSLDVSCEGNWQGAYRIQRSANYFAYLAVFYGSTPTNHSRSVVAGVGHDGSAMITSAEARQALFGTTGGGTGGSTNPTIRSVGTGANAAAGATTSTVSKPAGLAIGDYLLGVHVGDADNVLTSMTAPTGFTALATSSPDATNNVPAVKLWGKVATSTETAAASFSFGDAGAADAAVVLIAITTGTYNTSTPVTAGTWNTMARPPGTQPQDAPSITGVANALLLAIYGSDTNGVTQAYPSTGPSGMNPEQSLQGAVKYAMAGVYSLVLSSAGATGTKSVTPTPSVSTNGWAATQILINTAASAAVDTTDFFFANV